MLGQDRHAQRAVRERARLSGQRPGIRGVLEVDDSHRHGEVRGRGGQQRSVAQHVRGRGVLGEPLRVVVHIHDDAALVAQFARHGVEFGLPRPRRDWSTPRPGSAARARRAAPARSPPSAPCPVTDRRSGACGSRPPRSARARPAPAPRSRPMSGPGYGRGGQVVLHLERQRGQLRPARTRSGQDGRSPGRGPAGARRRRCAAAWTCRCRCNPRSESARRGPDRGRPSPAPTARVGCSGIRHRSAACAHNSEPRATALPQFGPRPARIGHDQPGISPP